MSKKFVEVKFKFRSRDTSADAHLVARNSIMQPFGCDVCFTEHPDYVPLMVPVE
jgi:hypothetical protein